MQIAELQQRVDRADRDTQWNLLTTPQLVCHLTEEVGELVQCINRLYAYTTEREAHLANLERELADVLWFMAKIANRFQVDLDGSMEDLLRRMQAESSATDGRYREELIAGLRTLDSELSAAKSELGLA